MNLIQRLCEPFGGLRTETAKELEKIADRHAVDFGIWLSMWCELSRDRNGMYIYQMNWYTAKELLKIYKKEKGL